MDSDPNTIILPDPPPGAAGSLIPADDGWPPKVVEWEDLQQELARLWSLSSAVKKGKERKEELARCLESVIEMRKKSLSQANELEEMRQKLELRKLAMANLSTETNRRKEDINKNKEHLCLALRELLIAGKMLGSAHNNLQEANQMLSGEMGYGHLKELQRLLRTRQQHMVSQVSFLYPVKTLGEQVDRGISDAQLNGQSAGLSSPDAAKPLPSSSLTILGLQLTTIPLKSMSFFSDKKEVMRSASVLGYVAHAVTLISSYLDVPIRYPLYLGGSHSYIHDRAQSTEPASSDLVANPASMSLVQKRAGFPLFLDGQDTTRAAYAIFLLNKDLEQLLNFVGAESLGPRNVLANLKELMRIILSEEYISFD